MSVAAAIQMLACVAMPALAIWSAERFRVAKLLGPVVLCYFAGIVLANAPGVPIDKQASMSVSEIAVPLAIPLLLFSTQVRRWLGLARSLLVGFGVACFAAVSSAAVVGWLFRAQTDEWWKIAGMLVGVYVGGTANMTAIGLGLETRSETFVLVNAAEVLSGGAYLLFMLSLAQPLLSRVLRPFSAEAHHEAFEHPGEKLSVWTRKHLAPMAKGFGLALGIVAVSAGVSVLIFKRLEPGLTLLLITTLGIAASLSSRVQRLSGAFELGEYVLLVFCVAVGTLADVRQITGTSGTLALFVVCVLLLTSVVHYGLCAALRIDVDTAIITSTATIFGPPFIGPMAAALKNRALVGPGLTLALAGIALGTYFGMLTAYGLRALAHP